jgi:chorismate mutase
MDRRGVEELREELARLTREHIESLNQQTFGGLDDELLRLQEERLKHIREVSAEFLAALKRDRS